MKRGNDMDEKTYKDILPSDQKINASSPGTLALERFKLAMALGDDESEMTQQLKEFLLENASEENKNKKIE